MTCFGERIKPVSAWMIVNYRWKTPYAISSLIRRTRRECIKAVTDSTGWTWKKYYRMGMRVIKVQVMPE